MPRQIDIDCIKERATQQATQPDSDEWSSIMLIDANDVLTIINELEYAEEMWELWQDEVTTMIGISNQQRRMIEGQRRKIHALQDEITQLRASSSSCCIGE